MRYAGRTHPGRREGRNEDSIGWNESSGLWFVADGMGGHASGEVASHTVKEALLDSASSLPLSAAVRKAHDCVVAKGKSDAAYTNMGSTVVALRIADGRAEVVWVGDSRAYLWRAQSLRLLTRDHSFLEMLREQQNLSDTQLREHPNRNLVTQTLGLGTPEPSTLAEPLRNRDWLLLCSDGLNDELKDDEIATVLLAHSSPDAAADALIEAALAKGGRDNVSALVVEYDGPNGVSFARPPAIDWAKLQPWLPIFGGVFAAVMVAALWWWLYGR